MRLALQSFLLTVLFATACASSEISMIKVTEANQDALRYVGTIPESGKMQLQLLLLEGLKKEDHVLEIGCGALVASIPIISFLESHHFVGIDPNRGLIEASLNIAENREITNQKHPRFIYNYNFDAATDNCYFDYIISHSIISHAAHWQLLLFLEKCHKVLKENGKVVFSLRLTEPNEFGNLGADQESMANEWVYPQAVFFNKETIIAEASKWFKKVEHKKEFTELMTSANKWEYHDWFVLTK